MAAAATAMNGNDVMRDKQPPDLAGWRATGGEPRRRSRAGPHGRQAARVLRSGAGRGRVGSEPRKRRRAFAARDDSDVVRRPVVGKGDDRRLSDDTRSARGRDRVVVAVLHGRGHLVLMPVGHLHVSGQ